MFQHPFTYIIGGPTKAGKTCFVKKLIQNRDTLLNPTPTKIWWCFTEEQPGYDDLKDCVTFCKGTPDINLIRQYEPKPQLLILDDLMQELENDSLLVQLFTRGCHHWNVSVIHIVQNIFFKGLRTSRINAQYLTLFKNPSDQLQVRTLGRQLFPSHYKYFLEAYADATSVPHGYLLIDLTQYTDDNLRLRTDIFNKQVTVYRPKV
jgi:hypothetical protein